MLFKTKSLRVHYSFCNMFRNRALYLHTAALYHFCTLHCKHVRQKSGQIAGWIPISGNLSCQLFHSTLKIISRWTKFASLLHGNSNVHWKRMWLFQDKLELSICIYIQNLSAQNAGVNAIKLMSDPVVAEYYCLKVIFNYYQWLPWQNCHCVCHGINGIVTIAGRLSRRFCGLPLNSRWHACHNVFTFPRRSNPLPLVLITSLISDAVRERLGRGTSGAIILLETKRELSLHHEHYFTTSRNDFASEQKRSVTPPQPVVLCNEIHFRRMRWRQRRRRQCNNDDDGGEDNTWWHGATPFQFHKKTHRHWMIKI